MKWGGGVILQFRLLSSHVQVVTVFVVVFAALFVAVGVETPTTSSLLKSVKRKAQLLKKRKFYVGFYAFYR